MRFLQLKAPINYDQQADKKSLMEAIFSAVQGRRGPYKLLAAMQERHVRVFLQEHWGKIAANNKPFNTDIDHIDYDVPTCDA